MKSGSLANRMRIGFAITFALLVGVTVIGSAMLFQARHAYEQDTTRSFESEIAAERMRQSFLIEQMALPAAVQGDPSSLERLRGAQLDGSRATADARALVAGEDRMLELIDARTAALRKWRERVVRPALVGELPPEPVQTRLGQAVLAADRNLIRAERERRVTLSDNVNDTTRDTTVLIGIGIVCGLIAALLLFTGLVASMRRPLERLVEASGKLAAGDLSTRVRIGGPSETVALGRAFNEMASELQVAHRKTEESRARLAATLESLADGILTISQDGTVTDANPAAERLLPEAAPGSRIQDALAGRVPADELDRLLGGLSGPEIEVSIDDRVLAITASSMGSPGGEAVISVRDISERVRLERLKDEFVLTASHELRSPLTSVLGFAEILHMQRDQLPPAQVETVEIILDNTRHLVRLLNDLLDLARSDAGQLQINPEPTDLGPLVDGACRSMLAATEAKEQQLVWSISPGLPAVMAEPDRIRQILANLLTNANEYCPSGAKIEVLVAPDPDGGGVQVSVVDNGPGIPTEQLDQIFERFTRGDAGLTQRVGGTGLGLAISKSLIELHGGSIRAEQTPGGGASFHFVLPEADRV